MAGSALSAATSARRSASGVSAGSACLTEWKPQRLRHAALGRDIDLARRVLADDHHGEAGLDAGAGLERGRAGLHGRDHGGGGQLAIDDGGEP